MAFRLITRSHSAGRVCTPWELYDPRYPENEADGRDLLISIGENGATWKTSALPVTT